MSEHSDAMVSAYERARREERALQAEQERASADLTERLAEVLDERTSKGE